jgi:hypothetical protein
MFMVTNFPSMLHKYVNKYRISHICPQVSDIQVI